MPKIGRNDPCPCGSKKKYKRCHGFNQQTPVSTEKVEYAMNRLRAAHVQRERQQGMGMPIISAEAFGHRFVAVKNRLLHSKGWLTFHDFLGDYIKMAMGVDWSRAEFSKSLDQRHPIMVWHHLRAQQLEVAPKEPGKVHSIPMTGAIAAYLRLAYDLYALDHNAELQDNLVNRLRNKDNFPGARYEVFVAATLIRGGFELEFENENDGSTSHCEFTATCKKTGRKFSVEAKHRAGNTFRLGRQLNRALAKRANHTRLVFIDINVPDGATDAEVPAYMQRALADLRKFEGKIINGKPLPDAYLVVTNTPWHHHLDTPNFRCVAMAEGFQIHDLKIGSTFPSLRAAIDSRDRHIEMYDLIQSVKDHAEIPSTFDGEIPEFEFGNSQARLLIGQRYLVTDPDGNESPGLLTSASVNESEQKAYCGLSFPSGKSGIYIWPLSDVEMAAWRKYPDTFFGTVGQRSTKAEDPIDLYDFIHNSYRLTPKQRLLEFMADAPDFDELRKLEQPQLASIYAERCACSIVAQQSQSTTAPTNAESRNRNT
jgi:hypothetical protein